MSGLRANARRTEERAEGHAGASYPALLVIAWRSAAGSAPAVSSNTWESGQSAELPIWRFRGLADNPRYFAPAWLVIVPLLAVIPL